MNALFAGVAARGGRTKTHTARERPEGPPAVHNTSTLERRTHLYCLIGFVAPEEKSACVFSRPIVERPAEMLHSGAVDEEEEEEGK